jgi:hypothetical protein
VCVAVAGDAIAPRLAVLPSPKSSVTLCAPGAGVTVKVKTVAVVPLDGLTESETELPTDIANVAVAVPARAVTVAAALVVRVTCASPLPSVVA